MKTMKVLLVVVVMIVPVGAQENNTTEELSEREMTLEAFIAEVSNMSGPTADLSGLMLKAAVFFCAIALKQRRPDTHVRLLPKSRSSTDMSISL